VHTFSVRLGAFVATVSVLLGVTALTTAAPAAAAPASINGGGSGFAALEMDQWRADTASAPYNLSVNYVSQGSSFGRQSFSGNNVDFGVSDITYQNEEISALQAQRCGGRPLANCFVYVPVSAGGVSFMYNLTDRSGNRITDLRLTRQAACRIFTGAIVSWNDPLLVRYNPRLAGVSTQITPFIRADGAGESFVFSEFCLAVDRPDWNRFIADRLQNDPGNNVGTPFAAGQPTSNWPAGWGRANPIAFADGVANAVTAPGSAGAITYVAAGYAKVRNFPVASVQNAAGVFTQPDEDNVTVALGYAIGRADGTFSLRFDGPDPRAYFPSTYSYVLAQTTAWDPNKGATLSRFLCYAVSKGQEIGPRLRYARLSTVLVALAISKIVAIPGAPSAAQCPVAGSAAPPPPPVIVGGPGAGTGGGGPGGGTGDPGAVSGPGAGPTGPGSVSGPVASGVTNPKTTAKAARAAAKLKKALIAISGVTTTTNPTVALDTQLRAAALNRAPAGEHRPAVLFLVLGLLTAAVLWAASRARKASA
jgi:phosphate transport system substrate-binding protein